MTFAMWERLREIAGELDADTHGARVIVFTGAGTEAFVSGTDIGEFRAFAGADDGVAYEARIEAVIDALEAIRVPPIAAIAGACTGGGVSIAAAATCASARLGARRRPDRAHARQLHLAAQRRARRRLIGLDAVKALLLTGDAARCRARRTRRLSQRGRRMRRRRARARAAASPRRSPRSRR